MSDTKQKVQAAVIPPLDMAAIKERIRQRHMMRLDDSDPVLAVATLMEAVTEQTGERFTAALAVVLEQAILKSVSASEAIVDKAADHVASHSTEAMKAVIDTAVNDLKQAIDHALQVQRDINANSDLAAAQSRVNMIWSWWGAFASLLLGGLFLGLILAKFL